MQSFDSLWKCFFVDFQEAYRLMNLKRTKTCTLKFSFDCIESQQSTFGLYFFVHHFFMGYLPVDDSIQTTALCHGAGVWRCPNLNLESSKATNCSDLGYCLSYLGFVGLYPTDS